MLRDQIRNNGNLAKKDGKIWIARDNKIYSFLNSGQNSEQRDIKDLTIYEFSETDYTLNTIIKSATAVWNSDKIVFGK